MRFCGDQVETESGVEIPLRLLTKDEWESRVDFPVRAKADVTLRRLQVCRFEAGADVTWECGSQSGVVCADENGLVTVPGVEIGTDPVTLILRKA